MTRAPFAPLRLCVTSSTKAQGGKTGGTHSSVMEQRHKGMPGRQQEEQGSFCRAWRARRRRRRMSRCTHRASGLSLSSLAPDPRSVRSGRSELQVAKRILGVTRWPRWNYSPRRVFRYGIGSRSNHNRFEAGSVTDPGPVRATRGVIASGLRAVRAPSRCPSTFRGWGLQDGVHRNVRHFRIEGPWPTRRFGLGALSTGSGW